MSNLYNAFKNAALTGSIDLISDSLSVALVNTGYVASNAHAWSSISPSLNSAAPVTLTGKSVAADGSFSGAPVTFTTVAASGTTIAGAVIYKVGSPNVPIYFVNVGSGLPITPNGGDITVNWGAGGKLFTL